MLQVLIQGQCTYYSNCGRAAVLIAGAFAAGVVSPAFAQPVNAQAPGQGIETVTVIAVSPLPGTEIDAGKIAGETETLSMSDVTRDLAQGALPDAASKRLSSVSIADEQGSQFQPDFVYRGFEASPVSGTAEGVAVYQDGVRLNESFGDNVNWDLVPEFAVDRLTVQSNNPVFGLNAIGGAVTLSMKNGLNFEGGDAEISGGSFGNLNGNAEIGARIGKLGVYLGIGGLEDDGFRAHSPTALRQAYGDLAWQNGKLTLHLSASGALNDIGAVGPTPVQLLAQDPRAVFTWPQSTENEMELMQLRGGWRATDELSLSANVYFRHFLRHIVDGNTTDVVRCANDASQLCLEGNGLYPANALYDAQGMPVPASVLPPGATPGETDFTRTDTDSAGAAIQASLTAPMFGHGNNLAIGASFDRGVTNYAAYGELGTLNENLQVLGSGVIIDQGLSPTAQPPIEEPVNVDATNRYAGFYAIDVFDLTPQLSWTLSARLNIAQIGLQDRLGDALTGDHAFTRLNPGTGLAYRLSDRLTLYGGYSESNRAPTAGELSCANPSSPCLLGAFLVSDPNLQQVVSRNIEFGLRGKFATDLLPGRFSWRAGAHRTDADRDIQLLATRINGFGYFSNAGTTRHQGVDAHLDYHDDRWRIDAGYSWLDATFLSAETISSNSPAANAEGLIFVRPGDRLPLNPANRFTLSADFAVTPTWSIGADLRVQSGEYLAGDESNQQPQLPGYGKLDVRTSWRFDPRFELFGEIANLLDQRTYTSGAFAQLAGLPPNFDLTDPRTYSPAPGRLLFAGVRARLD